MVKDKRPLDTGLMELILLFLYLRMADNIMHNQPWAEDGRVGMAGIYNSECWSSFLWQKNKYFQSKSRLMHGDDLWFRLYTATLVASILTMLTRCFLMGLILSKRFYFVNISNRIVLILYLISVPDLAKGSFAITNVRCCTKMCELPRVRALMYRALPQFTLS